MQEIHQQTLNEQMTAKHTFALFVYTPMCGTCKVAERMLSVALEALPNVSLYKINLNSSPSLAEKWQITSVPALILCRDGQVQACHYAIQSVGFVYDVLKSFS